MKGHYHFLQSNDFNFLYNIKKCLVNGSLSRVCFAFNRALQWYERPEHVWTKRGFIVIVPDRLTTINHKNDYWREGTLSVPFTWTGRIQQHIMLR